MTSAAVLHAASDMSSSERILHGAAPCLEDAQTACASRRCTFCHICGPAQSRQWKKQKKSFWKQAIGEWLARLLPPPATHALVEVRAAEAEASRLQTTRLWHWDFGEVESGGPSALGGGGGGRAVTADWSSKASSKQTAGVSDPRVLKSAAEIESESEREKPS